MLEAGKSLLHFRLVEKIGEGGMGVVWKAVDTTLNREVAIKVLPDGFAGEADRLARFEREAKLLASLNHPNIAGIFGIHNADGHSFLAMELIDGEDLQQRLARGPLSRADALKVSLQIAQAFEVAHESGVIHRDLKPANVKLTGSGQVKVLDFGLAKALSQDPSNPTNTAMSPTMTSAGTVAGMLLGTAAYMSPEQAKGKPVDKRADIWSFGVVLLELFSGRRVFEGETISETLAAVIMKEVDLGGLPQDAPPQIRRLIERCLERDPDKRLRDIGEARIRIEEAMSAPQSVAAAGSAAPQPKSRLALLPWLVAVAALAGLGWSLLDRPEPVPAQPMRFTMTIDEQQPLLSAPIPMLAISPEGKRIAYMGRSVDERGIFLRHVEQREATLLKGTRSAMQPFFSPDGQWVGFESGDKLRKISVLGGPPTTLADANRLRGASWGSSGKIVFAPDRFGGLMLVSEAGGEPQPLTEIESKDTLGSPSHRWPEFLPDGKTVIFTSTENSSNYAEAEIVAVSIEDKSLKTLIKNAMYARYVHPGFLIYARENTLFAVRFDPTSVEVVGEAVPVLEGITSAGSFGCAQLAVSTNGTMLYLDGGVYSDMEQLVWLSRDGTESVASTFERDFGYAEISPDGSQIALEVISETDGTIDIWVLELERDTVTRLTFDETRDTDPLWSPDGVWLTYTSDGGGDAGNLYRRRADGTGQPERLTTSPNLQRASSWSPDGTVLSITEDFDETGADLMLVRPGGNPEIEAFVQTSFNEWMPFISPDGRWVAFASNQSGRPEIYVRPISGAGQQTRISTDGAVNARWSPDGRELLYRGIDGGIMAVRYSVENGRFKPDLPVKLFEAPRSTYSFIFQPTADGRVLMYKNLDDRSERGSEPVAVVNWHAELEAKVPKGE